MKCHYFSHLQVFVSKTYEMMMNNLHFMNYKTKIDDE
jgi:hypothetical protein